MELRLVNNTELDYILKLYKDAQSEPFCVWNDEYPTMLEINEDYQTNNLFVLVEGDEILGAISIVHNNEMDDCLEWKITNQACEIARIVIDKKHHGKGLASIMVKSIFEVCKNRGFKAIHLSCQYQNIPAIKTYQKLGFKIVGEKSMYNNHYYLCEKDLNIN
ncbi:MAG: GNAT family N-acetyltransferase [Bacilli bacterium]|nr:GNAT family N-acetyltransferase [Bacilli bacterium]